MQQPQFFPAQFQYTWGHVSQQGSWVEEMIPAGGGTVLLFGPAGVGKTTLACNMLNAIAQNQQFIGRNTSACNAMLLSLDTPQNTMIRRWIGNKPPFKPDFAFVPAEPFDCLDPKFSQSQGYQFLQQKVKENDIKLIVVDSLRDVFNGEMTNDDIPKQVYGIFQTWFNRATVVFLHHTRKQQIVNGKVVESNPDDEATGTKYWINKAQVSLYLKKLNERILSIQMGKSQCYDQWDGPLKMEIDGAFVTEWTKAKAAQYATTYQAAFSHCSVNDPNWSSYNEAEKDQALAAHLNISARTVRTMKAAYRKTIP